MGFIKKSGSSTMPRNFILVKVLNIFYPELNLNQQIHNKYRSCARDCGRLSLEEKRKEKVIRPGVSERTRKSFLRKLCSKTASLGSE